MELIDWRELYAANRAVIEGRRTPSTPLRTRTLTRDHPRRGFSLAGLDRFDAGMRTIREQDLHVQHVLHGQVT